MAVSYKVEGDKLIVTLGVSAGIDKDEDGEKSVEIGGSLELKLDGSEIMEELLKSSDFLAQLKAKLGL